MRMLLGGEPNVSISIDVQLDETGVNQPSDKSFLVEAKLLQGPCSLSLFKLG